MKCSARALGAEAGGTALLLAIVVGSGIMGERLAAGNVAVALLANSLATGFGLFALISIFGPASGAHFNPVVSLVEAIRRNIGWTAFVLYAAAQVVGALTGTLLAHAMFDLPLFQVSTHERSGFGQGVSELVATAGLLLTILGTTASSPKVVAAAVGAYIASAYWFTASTSFANPAVTLARSLTDTFAGIRPADVTMFACAQTLGAVLGLVLYARVVESPARG